MAKILTFGMVGGGPGSLVGPWHRTAINLDGRARLVAGAFSGSLSKTMETGTELGIDHERCYSDYTSMAASEAKRNDPIDFVVVVTPNSSHFPICKAFLEFGFHVVCDKPLAVTSGQCEELEAFARKKNLLFMVTYTYSGMITVRHAREIIAAGQIGDIRTVVAEYPQGWLAFENNTGGKQGAWRTDPMQAGRANALGDIGTHIENTVARMTGLRIKKLLAKMDSVVPGRTLDDNDFAMIQYDNGASGMYWCSQIAIGHNNGLRIRIYGSLGSVLWFQENSEVLTVVKADGSSTDVYRGTPFIAEKAAKYNRLPAGHTEGLFAAMANLYSSFILCIHAKNDGTFTEDMIDYPTASDGVDGLKFVEACLKSNELGNVWVDL